MRDAEKLVPISPLGYTSTAFGLLRQYFGYNCRVSSQGFSSELLFWLLNLAQDRKSRSCSVLRRKKKKKRKHSESRSESSKVRKKGHVRGSSQTDKQTGKNPSSYFPGEDIGERQVSNRNKKKHVREKNLPLRSQDARNDHPELRRQVGWLCKLCMQTLCTSCEIEGRGSALGYATNNLALGWSLQL